MNKTAVCHISVAVNHINVKPVTFNLIKLTRTGFLSIKGTIRSSSRFLSSMD